MMLVWFLNRQGNEPQVFRSKFDRWDDVVTVDHRPMERSVLDRRLQMTRPVPRINVNDLFLAPKPADIKRIADQEQDLLNKVAAMPRAYSHSGAGNERLRP